MSLCQLTCLPPNVAGRQRIVDSDICWIFGIFLSTMKTAFGLQVLQLLMAASVAARVSASHGVPKPTKIASVGRVVGGEAPEAPSRGYQGKSEDSEEKDRVKSSRLCRHSL